MSEETKATDMELTDFGPDGAQPPQPDGMPQVEGEDHTAADLEAVFDIPVNVSAVLGRTHMEVSHLLKLATGDVVELDRKVGEAIDIFVNNRLVARGEVVLVEDHLGVTMTEIIKSDRN
ncbi:MAG: flagellar motor switch protein FliN [Hyphomicrobiales bacterium]